MTTIGVIGLGRMGGNMSVRLLDEGFDVIGYDVSEAAMTRFVDAGGERRDTPAAIASDAAVVVTSLPGPDAVETVLCGADGLLEGGDGYTVLEASTSDPDTTLALAELASEEGVLFVDAPASGGPGPAASGALSLMIGASEDDIDSTAREVVETIAAKVYYLGDRGAGHTAKLINNVLAMGNLLLAMEALTLGVARGVDLEALYAVISNASGASAQFEKRAPRVMNRNFEAGFTVRLTRKDLDLALRSADAIDYPMIAGSVVLELYKEACAKGYGEEDACAIVKLFEDHTGVEVETATEMDESFEGY